MQYANSYVKTRLGGKPIAFITTSDIQKLYNDLQKNGRINNREKFGNGLASSTVSRVHCMLHETFEMAIAEHAKTREECEIKLAEMIAEMKAEIKAEKERLKAQRSA